MEYEFFRAEGPEGKFSNSNTAIRSHTMKNALRVRSNNTSMLQAASEEALKHQAIGLKGRFQVRVQEESYRVARSQGQSKTRKSKGVGLQERVVNYHNIANYSIEAFGNTLLDPFQSFPIPNTDAVDFLLKYFITSFDLNLSRFDSHRPWIQQTLRSALMMHTTLASAAVLFAARVHNPDRRFLLEVYRHRGEAIHILQRRLEAPDKIDLATSNELIAGIAALANSEALDGNLRSADLHLSGVKKLIEHRGGIETIQNIPILRKCLSWIDLQLAAGLGRSCEFPDLDQHRLDTQLFPSIRTFKKQSFSLFLTGSLDTQSVPAEQIIDLLHQAAYARDNNALSPETIRSIMNTADRLISNNLFGRDSNPRIKSLKIYTLLLAAQVILYVGLRAVPTNTALAHILVQRLQLAILGQEAEEEAIARSKDEDPLLLWVAFIGWAACGGGRIFDGLRQFFLFRIRKQVRKMIVEKTLLSSRDFQSHLESFLWIDTFCRPTFRELFQTLELILPDEDLAPALMSRNYEAVQFKF